MRPTLEVAVKFTRITVDPKQMGGVPCLRGLRVPVATVLEMLAEGMAKAEILAAAPDLEPEDIHEALRYAAAAMRKRARPTRPGATTRSTKQRSPSNGTRRWRPRWRNGRPPRSATASIASRAERAGDSLTRSAGRLAAADLRAIENGLRRILEL